MPLVGRWQLFHNLSMAELSAKFCNQNVFIEDIIGLGSGKAKLAFDIRGSNSVTNFLK